MKHEKYSLTHENEVMGLMSKDIESLFFNS